MAIKHALVHIPVGKTRSSTESEETTCSHLIFGVIKLVLCRKKVPISKCSIIASDYFCCSFRSFLLLLLLSSLYLYGHDDIECQSKILFSTKIYLPAFSINQGTHERENQNP